jgi:transcriptional regulator with XRE-family HTH domain
MHKQVGPYLQNLRQQRGLSIRQLSRQVGFTPSYLSLVERGRRDLSIPALYSLINALNGDFVNALHRLALDAGVPADSLPSDYYSPQERIL